MKIYKFNAKTRTQKGKTMDKNKTIPAVIYGRNIKPVSLAIDLVKAAKLYDEAGESSLINLTIDDQEPVEVLIKDVQMHPVKDQIMHIDFYQIMRGQKIEAEVELKFVNESPAVHDLHGVLVTNVDAVDIKCLPKDLVSEIEVDLSQLKTFDDAIYVKDLKVGEEVEILSALDSVVAAVQAPRSEEEIASLNEEVKEELPEGAEEEKTEGEAGEAGKEEKPAEEKTGEEK